MATVIPPITLPPFDPHEQPVGPRWTKWLSRLDNYLVAANITDPVRQKALLLHHAGEQVHDIFDALPPECDAVPTPVAPGTTDASRAPVAHGTPATPIAPGTTDAASVPVAHGTPVAPGTPDAYGSAKARLTSYFAPKRNVQFEVYTFQAAHQDRGETLDQFATRLRMLARHCEYADVDREIKTRIIQACQSTRLRRRALREDMTLTELLAIGRALETSEAQATDIERGTDATVNRVQPSGAPTKPLPKPRDRPKPSQTSTVCGLCGGHYPHAGGPNKCPAHGKTCYQCGKNNHFSHMCRSGVRGGPKSQRSRRCNPSSKKNEKSSVHQVATHQDSSSDDEYIFAISPNKHPNITVRVSGTPIKVLIDSGASKNLLDRASFDQLDPSPRLASTNTRLFSYGSTEPLPILGTFTAPVSYGDAAVDSSFFVVEGSYGSLLSFQTAKSLGLLEIIQEIDTTQPQDNLVENLLKTYNIDDGIGKLKDYHVQLHINASVPPIAQPHRRVPFHMRRALETELDRLEQQDIIEPVSGPTPWVSPVVCVPKPKDPSAIRVCVDMRRANTAILRERHITPTVNEIIHDLNGAKVFSKVDLRSGYHQLELAPESRSITTFSTHRGLYRYKRLSFGICSASEVFQNVIQQTLSDIKGVRNFSDDIIVFGANQHDHDKALTKVIQRLHERGLTINRDKCVFNQTQLDFYGYTFSSAGMSADPKKVSAIVNAKAPENASEVRSLLGMTNYLSRFIPHYADLTADLRSLTKKDTPWTWTKTHDEVFRKLKEAMTTAGTMAYFDPKKDTRLIVDASPHGLGAILCQTAPNNPENLKVIAYGSRALTSVERRYSQTEREALAIVWGCEYFHLFIHGHKVSVVTDHKPVQLIWSNPSSKPSARIERWGLRLQPYDVEVVYRPGKDNPADYMSRHPEAGTSPAGATLSQQA